MAACCDVEATGANAANEEADAGARGTVWLSTCCDVELGDSEVRAELACWLWLELDGTIVGAGAVLGISEFAACKRQQQPDTN